MDKRLPLTRWLILAAVLAGVVAVRIFLGRQPEPEWIPSPVIDPKNQHATVQWDFREIAPAELRGSPERHPGHRLALAHCTRCHLLPAPEQLPRETWPFVLSWMANYLGYRNVYGPLQVIVDEAQIPGSPLIGADEFRELSEYYLLFAKTEAAWRTPPRSECR